MRLDRAVVFAVAACIVALALATGPAGPIAVDPPGSDQQATPGTGNATVEVLSEPEAVTLEPSDDGQDLLYLEVPPVALSVTNVSGNPLLSYVVALEEIGVATDSVAFLGDGSLSGEDAEMTIDRRAFQPGEVETVTEAELELRLRGDRTVTLFEVTVPVQRPDG